MMLSPPLCNMLDGIGQRAATRFAVVMPDGETMLLFGGNL